MATAEHPEQRSEQPTVSTAWDGRTRCRLCGRAAGEDHEWCSAAGALVCDACCEEVLGGEPGKLQAAANAGSRTMAPLEILASCAMCPRLGRMVADEPDPDEIGPKRVH